MNKEIRIECEGSHLIDIDKLIPFQGKLKDLTQENYFKLRKEILELGFSEPISVWNDKILNGHQRIRTLKQMREEGYIIPKIPINKIKAKNEKEAKKKILALTSQYGEITNEGLAEFMAESGLDLKEIEESFRFPEIDFKDFDRQFNKDHTDREGEDEIPEINESKIRTKLGDIYELGAHRLMCGDSTVKMLVEKLTNGEKVDMVFTDPPYGMNLDTDYSKIKGSKKVGDNYGRAHKKVANDDKPFDASFIFIFFPKVKEIFLFGADYYRKTLPEGGGWIVWDKTGGNDSLMNAGFASNFELCWSKVTHKRDLARITWKGVCGHNKKDDGEIKMHPTIKPVKLIEWFFERYKGENVVDLFCGSGSTLIACEKTNRKCFMMELDPYYCDVIVSRWCKYTNQTKIKLNGKEIEWSSQEQPNAGER